MDDEIRITLRLPPDLHAWLTEQADDARRSLNSEITRRLEGGHPAKVYLATAGEYSDYRVRHVFARREDAEAYQLGDDVEERELQSGPVEVRRWYVLRWEPRLGDRPGDGLAMANPHEDSEYRDFDGQPGHAEHQWIELAPGRTLLKVGGWNLARVRKVYSEQRAQYLAQASEPNSS